MPWDGIGCLDIQNLIGLAWWAKRANRGTARQNKMMELLFLFEGQHKTSDFNSGPCKFFYRGWNGGGIATLVIVNRDFGFHEGGPQCIMCLRQFILYVSFAQRLTNSTGLEPKR